MSMTVTFMQEFKKDRLWRDWADYNYKIQAIKMYRRMYGCSLREAKDAVERYIDGHVYLDALQPSDKFQIGYRDNSTYIVLGQYGNWTNCWRQDDATVEPTRLVSNIKVRQIK